MMRMIAAVLMLTCAGMVSAGSTMYKCESGGKIIYSDRPCEGTNVKEIKPQSGPTAEAQAQAHWKLDREVKAQKRKEIEEANGAAANRGATWERSQTTEETRRGGAQTSGKSVTNAGTNWGYSNKGSVKDVASPSSPTWNY